MAAFSVPNSSRSSFLMSPSPSPEPPSRSASRSFNSTSSHSHRSHNHSPPKRKRHQTEQQPSSPALTDLSSLTASTIARSNSNSTVLSSGPFSSQSSQSTCCKDYGSSTSSTRKPSPNLKSPDTWHTWDAPCIGLASSQERVMDMAVGGLRRRDRDEGSLDDAYKRWLARSRASGLLDSPDSPRSAVSKRMYELGLVDHLDTPSRSNSLQSKTSNYFGEYSTTPTPDSYYDVLGEYETESPVGEEEKKRMRFDLKALYSPCPTLTREPIIEESMLENPKLWPATRASLGSGKDGLNAGTKLDGLSVGTGSKESISHGLNDAVLGGTKKRRRGSVSPPLAPRVVSTSAFHAPQNASASVPVPLSKPTPPPSIPMSLDSPLPPTPASPPLTVESPAGTPHTRSSSPPLPTPSNPNPLTWHATEITGHVIDPYDADDDGTGINGVGFRPTKQEEEMRRLKRKRQIEMWKKREERERRGERWRRRWEGEGGLLGMSGGGSGRRRVRFES